MYMCTRCGYITDDPPIYAEMHPIGEGYAPEILQNLMCPCCRNEMDAAETCKVCGEIKSEEETDFYEGMCEDCVREKAKDLDTVVKCAKLCTAKEKVKVNPFLVFMLHPQTVDEILWEYFEKCCTSESFKFLLKDIYQRKAEEWATEDMSWFGDTLSEVMKNEQNGA